MTHGLERNREKETEPRITTVWTLRHAPTKWNRSHRIQGNVNNHILPETLEEYFVKNKVDAIPRPDKILVTELDRTPETAEAILKRRNWSDIPIIVKPSFNERRWGIFEGKTHQEIAQYLAGDEKIRAKYPDIQSMTGLSVIIDEPTFKVEGAESMEEVSVRVKPAFLQLAVEYPGEDLLLIAHAGTLISIGVDYNSVNRCELLQKGNTQDIQMRIDRPLQR